jgi:hypothetical protein
VKLIRDWTVDYGDGPLPIQVPHAWRQEVPVAWEGPAIYRTQIAVGEWRYLRFNGVSYEAKVFVGGVQALVHHGIWDAFEVDLAPWAGRTVEIEVRVVKNGGRSFPVRGVLSGFLPFVFHSFGGIHGEVVLTAEALTDGSLPAQILETSGNQIFRGGKPYYIRGLLHWGWYPELGHTNATDDLIRQEVRAAKELGFNLVKFCLWVPPHRYLEILEEEGMLGWLELPVWDPAPDALPEMTAELERIVRQYRHHSSIAIWTIGCELSHNAPPEIRRQLVERVKDLTGCPLVKDNSGGAEMYGGSLEEFGDFHDYHPYCDTAFFGPVLESLANGPRRPKPVLLGEFNDIDAHRNLPRLRDEEPYWSSPDPVLNAQGSRWQQDLPGFLRNTPFATDQVRSDRLRASSRAQALFVRKHVNELVRQQRDIAGYVITGWRDTPISTAGMFDDWGQARYTPEECTPWNSDACFFRIPARRPPWVDGGNRPGWRSLSCFFSDEPVHIRLGSVGVQGSVEWSLVAEGRDIAAGSFRTGDDGPAELGLITLHLEPGDYTLSVRSDQGSNSWPVWVVARPDLGPFAALTRAPSAGQTGPLFLEDVGTLPRPFLREAAYEFAEGFPLAERWHALVDVAPGRALDPAWLSMNHSNIEVLVNRVDARTYEESPILVRADGRYITTFRPWGGLGAQAHGVRWNPAGAVLLDYLSKG